MRPWPSVAGSCPGLLVVGITAPLAFSKFATICSHIERAIPRGSLMRRTAPARAAALLAALTLGLTACAESESGGGGGGGAADETGPIKIGAVLDITGAGASLGVPERKTLELLAEQLERGRRHRRPAGRADHRGQPVHRGRRGQGDATKLVNEDEVDIVLGASRTGPSLAMRPIAESDQDADDLAGRQRDDRRRLRVGLQDRAERPRRDREHRRLRADARAGRRSGSRATRPASARASQEMLDELGAADGHLGGRHREVRPRRHRLHRADGQPPQRRAPTST